MITAKEAFEITNTRTQKIKEEKLKLVDDGIRAASNQELFSTKFTFAQLKPYVGIVVEALTEAGFSVSQVPAFITVSWAPKKAEPVKAQPVKVEPEFDETPYANAIDDEEYDDDQDDTDTWNS